MHFRFTSLWVFTLVLVFSAIANSSDDVFFVSSEPEVGVDDAVIIDSPRYAGHLFQSYSDIHAVCNILGFSRGLPGSVAFEVISKNETIPYAKVDKNGRINFFSRGDCITQIMCVGRIRQNFENDQVDTVTNPELTVGIKNNPRERSRKLSVSVTSDMTGVCIKMGYPKAIAGQLVKTVEAAKKEKLLVIDAAGKIEKVEEEPTGWSFRIGELKCISPKSENSK